MKQLNDKQRRFILDKLMSPLRSIWVRSIWGCIPLFEYLSNIITNGTYSNDDAVKLNNIAMIWKSNPGLRETITIYRVMSVDVDIPIDQ